MEIYTSYVVKSILVWTCIVLMFIGWLLTIIQTKNKNVVTMVKNDAKSIVKKGVSMVANTVNAVNDRVGDVLGGIPELITIFRKYGGYIVFISSWLALLMIEIFWRPYDALKNVDSKKLKTLLNGC